MKKVNTLIILSLLIPVLNIHGAAAHGGAGRDDAEVPAHAVSAATSLPSKVVAVTFRKTKDNLQSMYSTPKKKTDAATTLIHIATASGQYASAGQLVQLQAMQVLSLSPIFYKAPITDEQRRAVQNSLKTTLCGTTSPDKDMIEIATSLLLPKVIPATVKDICKRALLEFVTTKAADTPLDLRGSIIAALQKIPEVDVTIALTLLANDEEETRAARIREEAAARAARALEEEIALAAHTHAQEAPLALIGYTETDGITLPKEHKDFLVPVIEAANNGKLYNSGLLTEWNLMNKSGLSDSQKGKFQECIRKVSQLRFDAPYKILRAKIKFVDGPLDRATIELAKSGAIRFIGGNMTHGGPDTTGFQIDYIIRNAKTREELETKLKPYGTIECMCFDSV